MSTRLLWKLTKYDSIRIHRIMKNRVQVTELGVRPTFDLRYVEDTDLIIIREIYNDIASTESEGLGLLEAKGLDFILKQSGVDSLFCNLLKIELNRHIDERYALFLDRDGVLNLDTHYPHLVEDVHLTNIAPLIGKVVNDSNGIELPIVVTNQGGVGKGYYTKEDCLAFETELRKQLKEQGLNIPPEQWYHCFSDDKAHPDRKPNSGMLLRAMKEHNLIPLTIVGDKSSDAQAGIKAGCIDIFMVHQKPSLHVGWQHVPLGTHMRLVYDRERPHKKSGSTHRRQEDRAKAQAA